MKSVHIFLRKLKRAFSLATIAGATLLPASCNKDEPAVEQHDVVVDFSYRDIDKTLDMSTLQKLVQDKTVRYVYLSPYDHWGNYDDTESIYLLRTRALQPLIEMSPKMRGRGNFDFKPGVASQIPSDSLWFVKNGWTINKQAQK